MDVSLDGFEETVDALSAPASCSSTQQGSPFTFCVGEAFKTFKDLELKIKCEQAHFMKFWKRDSRTVEAAKKRVTRYLDEKIVYYEVTFCCINGGRKFKSSGEGIRSSL